VGVLQFASESAKASPKGTHEGGGTTFGDRHLEAALSACGRDLGTREPGANHEDASRSGLKPLGQAGRVLGGVQREHPIECCFFGIAPGPCPCAGRDQQPIKGQLFTGQENAFADRIQPGRTGVSVGAINGAIIAGNPPTSRIGRLPEFWMHVTAGGPWTRFGDASLRMAKGDIARNILNQMSAGFALASGANGFFAARSPARSRRPAFTIRASSGARSSVWSILIDLMRHDPLQRRRRQRQNRTTHTIRPEHVMASGALPPGLPAIEIEREYYWDGGLVSSTPLQWVVETGPRRDTLAFQVDLWSARGEFPRNMLEVMTREKEVRYSSRTRAGTSKDCAAPSPTCWSQLLDSLRSNAEAKLLGTIADRKVYNIIHLIYRTKSYEGHCKDYEFSRLSMEEHWRAGHQDARRTLRNAEVLKRPNNPAGVFTFDLAADGRE
jgi:NTE family protein